MKSILLPFWGICTLQRGPQHVPTHPLFMALLIATNLLVSTFLNLHFDETGNVLGVFSFLVINLTIAAGIIWIALYQKKITNRFPQTLSAMVGCDLILTLLVAIVTLFTGGPKEQLTQGVIVLIAIWSVSVLGYILHHALNITVIQGTFFAVAIVVVSTIFGGALTAPSS